MDLLAFDRAADSGSVAVEVAMKMARQAQPGLAAITAGMVAAVKEVHG